MAIPKVDLSAVVALARSGAKGRPAPAGRQGTGRDGRVAFMVHVDPELRRRLRQLATDEETTHQALGVEALEKLLAERGR